MTREDAINIMKVIVHMLEEKYDTDRVEDAVDMAIKALEQEPKETWSIKDVATTFERHGLMTEQEPCEDCRTCNKWSECECREKGHKNGTSIGYSIGECKDYKPCEDCISREFIEIVVNYPPADLCIYPEYKGKPYYSIKYRENGKTYVGFGTYKIEFLSQWIKEYFISDIQTKPKTEVLDKIRAEIKEESRFCPLTEGLERALEIIDKCMAESEE